MSDRIKEVNSKFDKLDSLTKEQDELQLSIPAINESIAVSLGAVNNANAIILEISRWKGDIMHLAKSKYLRDRIKWIVGNYNGIVHDYGLISGDKVMKFKINEFIEDYSDIPENERKINIEAILRKYRYDIHAEKWKEVF